MAFAIALDQEERRVFEARRSAAAATLATEDGTFGPKIRFASPVAAAAGTGINGASSATHTSRPKQRWGADDAEALVGSSGGDDDPFGSLDNGEDGGDGGVGEGEGGEGFRAVPGGGRRKGKMPLFRNAEGEVVSKHDAVICGR